MSIELIQQLASEILATSASKPTTLYLLEATGAALAPGSVARLDGNPIGVSPDAWPEFNGKPMEHLITVDLQAMPDLQTGAFANTRAIALFISDRLMNEAYAPNTQETAIIALSQADIDNGELAHNPHENTKAASAYRVTAVQVPESVFDESLDTEETPLAKLRDALFARSYAGGKPLWLQFDEHQGHFLWQFDEMLIDANLGGAGVMYVFADCAFWQC